MFRNTLGFMLCGLVLMVRLAADESDSWHSLKIPDSWRRVPAGELRPIAGYSWYRCQVRIPETWRGDRTTLFVEALDDARAVFVNGTQVGGTGTFPPVYRSGLGEPGKFRIAESCLRYDDWNVIAIRVYQDDPRPNFSVAAPVLLNDDPLEGIRLSGEWLYQPGDKLEWASLSLAGERATFRDVESVTDVDRFVSHRDGDSDPLSPEDALAAFEIPDDLSVELVLSEPEIAQPLFMTWDARDRLWVMEYRQYPDVAGVEMVSRDVYLRSVYDKVPDPPPFGAKGRDRISIHEDTNGDGVLDSHHTFVDGLNLATSFAIGRGGVFVTNPPYLLFYPDLNRDDVPDSDPIVLLEGFGLEDSHSVINSLRFGPDGWLYGAQGSTVSANVRRPGSNHPATRTMGQQIWRFHPELRKFEVFAEGGGNTFGCEIDSFGNIFSGHNGGDTRGFHYVQGGYSRKGFGKHGPLSNPYAFGFFPSMKHHKVARFTHNFVIYEDRQLPLPYRGRLFGIEPLQGQIVLSSVSADGSSFQTEDLSRVVKTDDQWFRPVDIKAGPDGAVYFADMYEQRIDHSSHYAGRIDRQSGRIYRLTNASVGDATPSVDLETATVERLLATLKAGTRTRRQTALRVLGDRHDLSINSSLYSLINSTSGRDALEYLWALHQSGGLTEKVGLSLLKHEDQHVRAWVVQLLCNDGRISEVVANALKDLAGSEPYVLVRRQLAASARRIAARFAVPVIAQLLQYEEDNGDVHQPLMLWWAVERHLSSDGGRALVREMVVSDRKVAAGTLFRQQIAGRLIRRYVQSGSREELRAATEAFRSSPEPAVSREFAAGFEQAMEGRSLGDAPNELIAAVVATGHASTALRMRTGDDSAIEKAIAALASEDASVEDRCSYLEAFGELGSSQARRILIDTLDHGHPKLRSSALSALRAFPGNNVAQEIVQRLPAWNDETRVIAETVLTSRADWVAELLSAVRAGRISAESVSRSAVRRMLLHDQSTIADDVTEIWGKVDGATTEQMKMQISKTRDILSQGTGNPRTGKALYMKNCGRCHRLFEEGGAVGPDLTAFQRSDLDRMLPSIVNPNLEIREGFENHIVLTADGRVFNGFLTHQDKNVLVLRNVDGTNVTLEQSAVEETYVSPTSIMPEGTLRLLNEQELRDLFAYLRSSQPVNY